MRIEKETFENKLYFDGEEILSYKISFPQLKCRTESCECEIKKREKEDYTFNEYYLRKAIKLKKECENELYREAKDLYLYNKKNGYPIIRYEIILDFTITTNRNKIISLYSDEYRYIGGAHGITIRTSETWDIEENRIIELNEWMKSKNYVSEIISNINNQIYKEIQKGNNIYFENYCCLTSQNFRVENYYIADNMIVVYYQQYDIAPYSSGILNFFVAWL